MSISAQIKSKQQNIRDLLDEANAIVALASKEERDLADEDQQRVDEILGSGDGDDRSPGLVDGLKADLTRLKNLEKMTVEMALPSPPAGGGIQDTLGGSDGQAAEQKKFKIHATCRRASQLKAFVGVIDGFDAEERAYRFGMYGLHILSACLPNKYQSQRADDFVKNRIMATAHGSGSPTFADYGIPEEFSRDLIRLVESRGTVRRLFDNEPMMSDTWRGPTEVSGMTTYAVGENAAGTESNMVLGEVVLVANKFMTLGRMSSEVNEDNIIRFAERLATAIAYSQADKEDNCGWLGDGTAGFGGIEGIVHLLQDFDGGGTDSVGLITGSGNSWGALALGDYQKVVAMLPEFSDTPNTAWACHRKHYYEVMQPLELAQSGSTAAELKEGERRPRPMFLGYPVEFVQVLPKTSAATQVCATLGDYGVGAKFGDRRGYTLSFSEDAVVGGESTFERDQLAVKATERYDIQVHSIGDATDAGAIVGLQTAT